MSYLGRSAKLSLKAQEKVSFLATAGQTVKTGLSYVPNFVEVYVNGILLTDTTDFTATNGNSVTFSVALALNDEVTVISLKTFSVAESLSKAGGTMTGDTLHGDNVKAKFGTGNDLEIYHDGNKSYISDVGTGNLILTASNLTVKDAGGTNKYLTTDASTTATTIYHNNVARLATTATGVGVTGGLNTTGPLTSESAAATNIVAKSTNGNGGYMNYQGLASNGTQTFAVNHNGTIFTTSGLAVGGNGAANTLDDYEEGSWTPSITRDSNPSIGSYQVRYGKYTKIGNQVTLFCQVASSTVSGGSGVWKCTGLPFSSAGINANTTVGRNYMSGDTNDRDFRIHSNVAKLITTSADSYYQSNVTYVIWTFTTTFQVS